MYSATIPSANHAVQAGTYSQLVNYCKGSYADTGLGLLRDLVILYVEANPDLSPAVMLEDLSDWLIAACGHFRRDADVQDLVMSDHHATILTCIRELADLPLEAIQTYNTERVVTTLVDIDPPLESLFDLC